MSEDLLNGITIKRLPGKVFLPFPDQEEMLKAELKDRFNSDATSKIQAGNLIYKEDWTGPLPYWASTCMLEPFLLSGLSIGKAAASLKKLQRSWAPYSFTSYRRMALIQEKLPYIPLKERDFPVNIPNSQMGLWTLLDNDTLLASAKTSSPLPLGLLTLKEDHENPPSRAYLKVQEALTLAAFYFNIPLPGKGSHCFEAGACPGGWTWVLVGLGAQVLAVDRAPLAQSLMKNPLVTFMTHDAFTLDPAILSESGKIDWVFSDVICYPERLLSWVKKWIEYSNPNMICTIKMQGQINWSLVQDFADIPQSKVLHLHYNKHELTFIHKGSL